MPLFIHGEMFKIYSMSPSVLAHKVNGKIRAILTVVLVRRVIFVPFLIAEMNSALPKVITQTAFFVALTEHWSAIHILVI